MDINQLTHIFCQIDDFCNEFSTQLAKKLLPSGRTGNKRGPQCRLADSEIMTILIAFQSSNYRHFKAFYQGFLRAYLYQAFPNLPSYQRFIELIPRVMVPLCLFAQLNSGKRTGIYYIDSSCLPVCHLKRSKNHKTFKHIAQYGKTSVAWFFGLKLHIVINDKGELIAFKITSGKQSDVKAGESLLSTLSGLAFGDKGYIGKKVAETLLEKGLKLITRTRKNMKTNKLSSVESQLLNQRNLVETVIGHLKFAYHVWHTRHRSVVNAMSHLLAALCAYTIEPLKLSAIKLLTGKNYLINPKTPN